MFLPPINFKNWIDERRHLFKPPVQNQIVYEDTEFIIMVVGGPNARTDFHVNRSEEFFYQLEGNIILRLFVDGVMKDVRLCEGEIFLLPPNIPHSPQRPAGSIGLVVERRRREGELDAFHWYCEKCYQLRYAEEITLAHIVKDLPAVFERYRSSPGHLECRNCGFSGQ